MTCKNCENPLAEEATFCNKCGAQQQLSVQNTNVNFISVAKEGVGDILDNANLFAEKHFGANKNKILLGVAGLIVLFVIVIINISGNSLGDRQLAQRVIGTWVSEENWGNDTGLELHANGNAEMFEIDGFGFREPLEEFVSATWRVESEVSDWLVLTFSFNPNFPQDIFTLRFEINFSNQRTHPQTNELVFGDFMLLREPEIEGFLGGTGWGATDWEVWERRE
ncbi:MAG: zinc ribbon domain-containing protein [Turicibacter sp.]|nr:zinc ribbon domain-containing protein [Turicibacter sp.]